MPHDESGSDQLWTYIQARKQADPANKNGHAPAAANGSAPSADAVLVEALYQTLQETNAAGATDGSEARAALQAVIAASPVRQPDPGRVKRPFWQLSGSRQVVQAVALLLITIAAIGYLVWSSWSASCQHSNVPAPSTSPAVGAPAPAPRSSRTRHRGLRGLALDQGMRTLLPNARKCQ